MIRECNLICDYQINDGNSLTKLLSLAPLKLMVSISSLSHHINIWQIKDLKLYKLLKGHSDIVCDVSFSKFHLLLFSSSLDRKVKIWNPKTGFCLGTFRIEDIVIIKIEILYDNKLFLFEGKQQISGIYPKLRQIDIFSKQLEIIKGADKTDKQLIYEIIELNRNSNRIAYTSGAEIIIFNVELNFIVKTLKKDVGVVVKSIKYFNKDFDNVQQEFIIACDSRNCVTIWNIFQSNIVVDLHISDKFQNLDRVVLFPKNNYQCCIVYMTSGYVFILDTENKKIVFEIREFYEDSSRILSLFFDEKNGKIYSSGMKGKFKVHELKFSKKL